MLEWVTNDHPGPCPGPGQDPHAGKAQRGGCGLWEEVKVRLWLGVVFGVCWGAAALDRQVPDPLPAFPDL